jgi:hypothetical protein
MSIDLTDDDEVDPDLATTWFEDITAELDRLSESDRAALATLIRRLAREEIDEARRAALLEFPESFGLDDE